MSTPAGWVWFDFVTVALLLLDLLDLVVWVWR
jgi:hypothetical protein